MDLLIDDKIWMRVCSNTLSRVAMLSKQNIMILDLIKKVLKKFDSFFFLFFFDFFLSKLIKSLRIVIPIYMSLKLLKLDQNK